MSIYALLGVSADANADTIKRAYAEKLRVTRPEDDPDGFQRLHEAYKRALQQCRQRRRHATTAAPPEHEQAVMREDRRASPAPAPRASVPGPFRQGAPDVSVPAQPPPDPAALVKEIIAHARTDGTTGLGRWLEHCEALWSLKAKSMLGVQLMRTLYETAPPISSTNQQVLLRFFDLDHVLAGHDPLALARLRKSMHLAWILMPEHLHLVPAWVEHTQGPRNKDASNLAFVRSSMQRLRRPYRRGRLVASALVPARARRLRDFMLYVSGNDPACLPRDLDRQVVGFWLDAGTSGGISKARLLVGATRSVLLTVLAGMAVVVALLHGKAVPGQPQYTLLMSAGAFFLALAIAWWLWLGFQIVDQWQTRDETEPVRWPWACLLFVPALALPGIGLGLLGPLGLIAGMPLLVLGVLFAARRMFRRSAKHMGRGVLSVPRMIWIGLFVFAKLALHTDHTLLLMSLLGLFALGFWGMDLWWQRYKLRVRPRRARTA